jgi:hypothetical protein
MGVDFANSRLHLKALKNYAIIKGNPSWYSINPSPISVIKCNPSQENGYSENWGY